MVLISSFFSFCNAQDQTRKDSLRQQKLLRGERARYVADSSRKAKSIRIKDFLARTPNLISWTPTSLAYAKVELMYERFLKRRFSVGLSAMYKYNTNRNSHIKERTYDSSPSWGGMPALGANQRNGYGNIWEMPYSQGYSLGAFSKFYFINNKVFVHSELFGQYASYDHVNVTWSERVWPQMSDSLKASVTSGGLKILIGSSVSIPVTQKLGVFFEYFVGCTIRMDYADLFHYKQKQISYDDSGEQIIVLKEMEPENVNSVTIKPQTGVRIGLRF